MLDLVGNPEVRFIHNAAHEFGQMQDQGYQGNTQMDPRVQQIFHNKLSITGKRIGTKYRYTVSLLSICTFLTE